MKLPFGTMAVLLMMILAPFWVLNQSNDLQTTCLSDDGAAGAYANVGSALGNSLGSAAREWLTNCSATTNKVSVIAHSFILLPPCSTPNAWTLAAASESIDEHRAKTIPAEPICLSIIGASMMTTATADYHWDTGAADTDVWGLQTWTTDTEIQPWIVSPFEDVAAAPAIRLPTSRLPTSALQNPATPSPPHLQVAQLLREWVPVLPQIRWTNAVAQVGLLLHLGQLDTVGDSTEAEPDIITDDNKDSVDDSAGPPRQQNHVNERRTKYYSQPPSHRRPQRRFRLRWRRR